MTNNNHALAALFSSMAGLLSTHGANPHRVRAYRRAGESILQMEEDIAKMAEQRELQTIPGIGKELSLKIEEFLASGTIRTYEELKTPLPTEVLSWINFPGFSEPLVQDLYFRLGIKTLDDLEKLVRSHLLRTIPGMDTATEEILARIQSQREGIPLIT